MKTGQSDLDVSKSEEDIVLANKFVELKLVRCDGGYAQEFQAIDRHGRRHLLLSTIHRGLIPFTEHRVTADPMLSARRQHLFELSRESLRMAFSEAKVTQQNDSVSVRLSGKRVDHSLSSTITLFPASKAVRVSIEAEFSSTGRQPIVEYLMAAYAFLPDGALLDKYGRPDYSWAPALRPGDDHIIAEKSFSSAAVVVRRGKLMAALVSDPESRQELPVALDLDLRNGLLSAPVLAYGYCPNEPDGPFSYHDISMLIRPRERTLSFAFWLYLDAEAKSSASSTPVQEFVWSQAKKKLPSAEKDAPEQIDDWAARIEEAVSRQRAEGVFELSRTDDSGAFYDTAEMSEFARWLLSAYLENPVDARILSACRKYADFLVSRQTESGAIPQRFSHDLIRSPEQKPNALTAASGRFLLDLYDATSERRYLSTALKAGKFLSALPWRARYLDSRAAAGFAVQDAHTGMVPHSSAALRAVADYFIALHRQTGEARHLKMGLSALVQMCWYQDTWSEDIGSFAKGNSEPGTGPSGAFARTLFEYFAVTHRIDHLERAIAAMRAGLAQREAEAGAVQAWAAGTFGCAVIDV